MEISVGDLADAIGGRAEGNLELQVHGLSEPSNAGASDLALAFDPKFFSLLADSEAQAALLCNGADWKKLGIKSAILSSRPRHALALASFIFSPPSEFEPGVHPSAIISPAASIGAECRIGPFAVVQAGAKVGASSFIGSNVSIGCDVQLGAGAIIYPGVCIGRGVILGDRFIAHANSVLGSDGFAFESSANDTVGREFYHQKINSLGSLVIGDDVEIGANCAIDRGTISNTTIGSGTKLDNLVHVAHNVRIGEDCIICGQVGIAGSAQIGDRVIFGGQVGIADNISIGNDVLATGASAVYRNVGDGIQVMGFPAIEKSKNMSHYRHIAKLPKLAEKVRDLERRLAKALKD